MNHQSLLVGKPLSKYLDSASLYKSAVKQLYCSCILQLLEQSKQQRYVSYQTKENGISLLELKIINGFLFNKG